MILRDENRLDGLRSFKIMGWKYADKVLTLEVWELTLISRFVVA